MRLTIAFLLSFFCINTMLAQDIEDVSQSQWNTLSMVTFERKFDENIGFEIELPVVSPLINALEGKVIELEGYIIPLTGKVEQNHFMLSRYPQNLCFFCGKAGPESAAQVFLKNEAKAKYTDDKIRIKGILNINATDINSLLYTIREAEIIKKWDY